MRTPFAEHPGSLAGVPFPQRWRARVCRTFFSYYEMADIKKKDPLPFL